MDLYKEGCERVDDQFNAVKIAKKIEYMSSCLEKTLMTMQMKVELTRSR